MKVIKQAYCYKSKNSIIRDCVVNIVLNNLDIVYSAEVYDLLKPNIIRLISVIVLIYFVPSHLIHFVKQSRPCLVPSTWLKFNSKVIIKACFVL